MNTITLSYITQQDLTLNSRLYVPDNAQDDTLPAVLVFPEWWGLSEHVQNRAQKLAEAGYVALAVDLYGNAMLTDDASIANQHMSELLNNPELLAERTTLAYNNLRAVAEVNPKRLAAMGFGFGGRVALDMAREGWDLKAVVGFHANLSTQNPAQTGVVKAAVLVEHGALDTMTTMEDVATFRAEMDAAAVNYQVDVFEHAKHGFTNPQATENGKRNGADLAYHEESADQAWQNALNWLAKNV